MIWLKLEDINLIKNLAIATRINGSNTADTDILILKLEKLLLEDGEKIR